MSWKRAVFYPDFDIKIHIIEPDTLYVGLSDIESKYGATPTSVEDVEELWIDPGGMLDMNSIPIEKNFGGLKVSVKPEHISFAILRWSKTREVSEGILKIYIGQFFCLIMTEKMHDRIGAWLMKNEDAGFKARLDMAERLAGCQNIHVHVPPKIDNGGFKED